MRGCGLVVAWAFLAGGSGLAAQAESAIPTEDLAVRLEPDRIEVEFGAPFELSVVRSWRKSLVPEPWDDAALTGVEVVESTVTRRENDSHVEEAYRLRGRVFGVEDVFVAPFVRARPVGGGNMVVAFAEELHVVVHSSLHESELELARFVAELPSPGLLSAADEERWRLWVAVATALVVAGVLGWPRRWRRRRHSEAGARPTRAELAARLAELGRAPEPSDIDAERALCIELAAIVRACVASELGLSVTFERGATSAEFLVALEGRLDESRRERIAEALACCDAAKFARRPLEAAARAALFEAAAAIVLGPDESGVGE